MKIYKIVKQEYNEEEANKESITALVKQAPILAAGVVPAAAVLAVTLKTKATPLSVSQAQHFTNATNADWKVGALYAEHPRKNQFLIPYNDYDDYIKREIAADVASYIMDHLHTKRILVSFVAARHAGANASIEVKKINADAKLSCDIEKSYVVQFEEGTRSLNAHEYLWIDRFPDVKVAVEHQSRQFEAINDISIELIADAKIAKTIHAGVTGQKKLRLYVSYYCD